MRGENKSQPIYPGLESFSVVSAWLGPWQQLFNTTWLWAKKNTPRDRRFWSIFPFPSRVFRHPFFDPKPHLGDLTSKRYRKEHSGWCRSSERDPSPNQILHCSKRVFMSNKSYLHIQQTYKLLKQCTKTSFNILGLGAVRLPNSKTWFFNTKP